MAAAELRVHRAELHQLLGDWHNRCEASMISLLNEIEKPAVQVSCPLPPVAGDSLPTPLALAAVVPKDASPAHPQSQPDGFQEATTSQQLSTATEAQQRAGRTSTSSPTSRQRSTCRNSEASPDKQKEIQRRWTMVDQDAMEAARTSMVSQEDLDADLEAAEAEETKKRGWFLSKLSRIVENPAFEWLAAAVILVNAGVVGAQVQHAADNLTNTTTQELKIAQTFFCLFYTLELAMRMSSEGIVPFFTGRNWTAWSGTGVGALAAAGGMFAAGGKIGSGVLWNLFDVVIVLAAIAEVILDYTVQDREMNTLLVARILRIARIVRIIRNIHFFRDLRMMVYSIFHTLRSLIWSFILIFTVMYLVSIVLVAATTSYLVRMGVPLDTPQWRAGSIDDCPEVDVEGLFHRWCELRTYFGSLRMCIATLFESIAGGVSWGDRSRLLAEVDGVYEGVFMVFVFFTIFAMLNVITGFFCERAVDMASQDREHAVQEQLRNKSRYIKEMGELFHELDSDGSGTISFDELEKHLDNEKVQAYFAMLQLDIGAAWDIFRLLDKDQSKSVDLDEFALGCLRLRGYAKTVDVASIQYEVEKLMHKMGLFMAFVETQFETVLGQDGASDQQMFEDLEECSTTDPLAPVHEPTNVTASVKENGPAAEGRLQALPQRPAWMNDLAAI